MKNYTAVIILFAAVLFGCENTDVMTATDAGLDAIKAITLSDQTVQKIAIKSAELSDRKNRIASPTDQYSKRLRRLVGLKFQRR